MPGLKDDPRIKPALIAGAAFGAASALPFPGCLNCACCGLLLAGGFVAVYLYQKQSLRSIDYGDGAVVGLWTGLFGGIIDTFVSLPFNLLEFAAFDWSSIGRDLPPNLRGLAESILAAEAIIGGTLALSLFFNLLLWLIFATIGAVIGVAVFQKNRPTPPPVPSKPDSPPLDI